MKSRWILIALVAMAAMLFSACTAALAPRPAAKVKRLPQQRRGSGDVGYGVQHRAAVT